MLLEKHKFLTLRSEVVVVALEKRHGRVDDHFLLRRHVDEHILLEPAQQKGSQNLMQFADNLLLLLLLNDRRRSSAPSCADA